MSSSDRTRHQPDSKSQPTIAKDFTNNQAITSPEPPAVKDAPAEPKNDFGFSIGGGSGGGFGM